jgi:uncharacterized membrane protein YkoI
MLMTKRFWKTTAGLVAFAALGGLVGATVAVGAGSANKGTTTTTTTATTKTARSAHAGETPLTGDVLAKVKAAAVAKVGGTVDSATTENDSDNANAAYEAHVTKADGTRVTVILDKSYNVLAVETGHHGHGPHGDGHGPGNGETELTGDVAAKAKAAAIAKVGGTVERASTENDSDNSAAAYEVHVTKTDGTHVTVILDKSFAVLSVETHADGPGDHGRHDHHG